MSGWFDQVEAGYQHYPKQVRPGPALKTPKVYFKWHLIYPKKLPISEQEILEAQAMLREELEAGRLELNHEVGFVVQHRTAEWMILYVCTWRGNNEIWETLYQNRLSAGAGYKKLEREDTSPTFCVWVMAAVSHEQKAWSRYLKSARDDAAQKTYLNDQLIAEVW
jgi:hypothetical protein